MWYNPVQKRSNFVVLLARMSLFSCVSFHRRRRTRGCLTAHCTIVGPSKMPGIPQATIRHDLEMPENQCSIGCTRIDAIIGQWVRLEPEYAYRARTYPDEKHRICIAAAALTAGRALRSLARWMESLHPHRLGRYQAHVWPYR